MQRLEDAKKRHAESGMYVESQKLIIASLRVRTGDVTEAEKLLQTFERDQENQLAEIERILDELDKMPLTDGDARS